MTAKAKTKQARFHQEPGLPDELAMPLLKPAAGCAAPNPA
jgi:hypothetical protein